MTKNHFRKGPLNFNEQSNAFISILTHFIWQLFLDHSKAFKYVSSACSRAQSLPKPSTTKLLFNPMATSYSYKFILIPATPRSTQCTPIWMVDIRSSNTKYHLTLTQFNSCIHTISETYVIFTAILRHSHRIYKHLKISLVVSLSMFCSEILIYPQL